MSNITVTSESMSSLFQYYYHDVWQDSTGDPRINRLPFMNGGPWTVLAIISAYVYFVKIWGPDFMAKRKPFQLKGLILTYNIFMIIINVIFFVLGARRTTFGLSTWVCHPIGSRVEDKEWMFHLIMVYFFFLSKFVDLFDTVFFVLRKNFHQVSSLHVIHHSLVPINCWLGLKLVTTESAAFMPFINSFVHAVMYSYYALSSIGPQMKPYLWWKKYLTSLQIIQLALITVHSVVLSLDSECRLPKLLFVAAVPQLVLIIFLFCRFFIRSYNCKDGDKKEC